MTDEEYMRKALEQAQIAYDKDEVPVGAVVVCRDRIIARAYNLTETLNDVTAHAEMQAITAAADALGGKYLDVCTLYVTVEPCIMCAGAIGWAQMDASYMALLTRNAVLALLPPRLYTLRQKLSVAYWPKNVAN